MLLLQRVMEGIMNPKWTADIMGFSMQISACFHSLSCLGNKLSSRYLSLDDVPGIAQSNVVLCVIQTEAVFQVLFGILTHLIRSKVRGQVDHLIRQASSTLKHY